MNSETISIPLKKLVISERIREAIVSIKSNIDFTGIFIKDDGTFRLSRMETMMQDNLYDSSERPPIDVKALFGGNFLIINGRHRVARAFILGHETIEGKIVM